MDALIVKLPDSTIQKIAAGEVITRPVNVVKELLENSIDAGATNIRITLEQGGLKLIEIVDNGHGIARSNAQLLCQRYATSKINTADDLTRISTFGFRGEALASISEMAEIEVKSFNMMTDKLGWQAHYKHGVPTGPIVEKYLQLPGTQIKVHDLFSNAMPRKNAMAASFMDEKKSITDLIMRFAIHHREKITLSLRDGSSNTANDLVCSIAPTFIGPCIGSFYGMEMENNLIDFSIKSNLTEIPLGEDEPPKADIYVAFSYKKSTTNVHQSTLILFVNNRLVECDELRREIAALVFEQLSMKHFISVFYIALSVPPQDVDVNTHPAKATVTLSYQQDIIALILKEIRNKFQENLATQVVQTKVSSQKTIGELIKNSSNNQTISQRAPLTQTNEQRLRNLAPGCFSQPTIPTPTKRPYDLVHTDSLQMNLSQLRLPPSRVRRDLKLRSIHELRDQVALEKSTDNIKTIKNSVFVGLFDHDRALIQHDTKLYAINLKAYLKEQLYQFYLFDFGNFPPIEILPPGNKILFMIETYLKDIQKHEPTVFNSLTFQTPESVISKLLSHSGMLQDYLSLEFTRNEVFTIPCIIPDHVPNLTFLGRFFVDLANKVDYSEERECFHKMGRVVADFYSEPPANLTNMKVHKKYHELVNTRLYEAIKRYLLIPDWLFTKENICQITDTKDLYKVFERC